MMVMTRMTPIKGPTIVFSLCSLVVTTIASCFYVLLFAYKTCLRLPISSCTAAFTPDCGWNTES